MAKTGYISLLCARQYHIPRLCATQILLSFNCFLHQCDAVLYFYNVGLVPHTHTKYYYTFAGCRHYSQVLPPSGTKDAAVLDMCSSWVSHYPKGYKLGRISGESLDLYRLCQPALERIASCSWIRCMLLLQTEHFLFIQHMCFLLLHMCFQLFARELSAVGHICL